MVDGWLGLGDRRSGPESPGFGAPRFHGLSRGEDEVAGALQHRFHLRNTELPFRELREIAVAKKFAECAAVPCERAVCVGDKIVKKLLGRSMCGAYREGLLDEGAYDLRDQVREGVRLLRADELACGQEFLERDFIRQLHAPFTAQQPPPAIAEARRSKHPSGPTGPEDFPGNVDGRPDIEDVLLRRNARKRVPRWCTSHTRSSRWRGTKRRVGAQTEEAERYGNCCQIPVEGENREGSFHQCLRERFLKKVMSEAT